MLKTDTGELSPLRVDLDKPVPMRAIRALAQIIAEKFDPEKIVLFGSYAYGHPKPWSDVDILVVMDTPEGPWPLTETIGPSMSQWSPLSWMRAFRAKETEQWEFERR